MITDRSIADQVGVSLGEHGGDFDVAAIVREIIAMYGLVDIDEIPTDRYWAIVERHEVGAMP